MNYDRWKICKDAVIKGKEENITVLDFLKEPLIIKYGEEWYNEDFHRSRDTERAVDKTLLYFSHAMYLSEEKIIRPSK